MGERVTEVSWLTECGVRVRLPRPLAYGLWSWLLGYSLLIAIAYDPLPQKPKWLVEGHGETRDCCSNFPIIL